MARRQPSSPAPRLRWWTVVGICPNEGDMPSCLLFRARTPSQAAGMAQADGTAFTVVSVFRGKLEDALGLNELVTSPDGLGRRPAPCPICGIWQVEWRGVCARCFPRVLELWRAESALMIGGVKSPCNISLCPGWHFPQDENSAWIRVCPEGSPNYEDNYAAIEHVVNALRKGPCRKKQRK